MERVPPDHGRQASAGLSRHEESKLDRRLFPLRQWLTGLLAAILALFLLIWGVDGQRYSPKILRFVQTTC